MFQKILDVLESVAPEARDAMGVAAALYRLCRFVRERMRKRMERKEAEKTSEESEQGRG